MGLGCRGLPTVEWWVGAGSVAGHVVGSTAEKGSWVVVYLEGEGGRSSRSKGSVSLRSGAEGLTPALSAVAAGQTVDIHNEDAVQHRHFSSSPGNAFELPTLTGGASHSITLAQPGLVRVYCSLHPAEHASIFVAPSTHFEKVRAPGPYTIGGVPPGRYTVHAWSEANSARSGPITVARGTVSSVEIALRDERP